MVSKGHSATVQRYIFQLLPCAICAVKHCPAVTECLIKAFCFDCFFQQSQVQCIIGCVNGLTLLQEVNREHSLTVPENGAITLPTDATCLSFFGAVEEGRMLNVLV